MKASALSPPQFRVFADRGLIASAKNFFPPKGDTIMHAAKYLCVAALAAASIGAIATSASAQSGRDGAIHKCIQMARAEFPDNATNDALTDRNRTQAYVACMAREGFTP